MMITGLILCGGRGTRMGNADKGLQAFLGRPMVAHVIERLAPQVASMLINANRSQKEYAAFGLPVIADATDEYAGPLAGMLAGMQYCTTSLLMSVPCDSPLLPADLVARLHEAMIDAGAELAVPVTDDGNSRQTHPVFCLADVRLKYDLANYLARGERRFVAWLTSRNCVQVPFDNEESFRNLNTLEELRALEATQGR